MDDTGNNAGDEDYVFDDDAKCCMCDGDDSVEGNQLIYCDIDESHGMDVTMLELTSSCW
jgi:hypothetical protein